MNLGEKVYQSPAEPTETLGAFIQQHIDQTGGLPTIEPMVFSGNATDWRKDGRSVYLRLTTGRIADDSGAGHEMWARLFAPTGRWVIPTVPTEAMVIAGPHQADAAGTGWCFFGVELPPANLSQTTAFDVLPDTVMMLSRAKGHVFKGASNCTFGVGTDGNFQVAFPNGTHLAITPTAIELAVCDGQTPNHVLASIMLDASGITLSGQDPNAPTGLFIWKLNAHTGDAQLQGGGKFFAMYTGGQLGALATALQGIAYGISMPSIPSTSWFTAL